MKPINSLVADVRLYEIMYSVARWWLVYGLSRGIHRKLTISLTGNPSVIWKWSYVKLIKLISDIVLRRFNTINACYPSIDQLSKPGLRSNIVELK